MTDYREVCFQAWGHVCGGCGASVGLEAHCLDGNHENLDPRNFMPLCGTCHNLVTREDAQINSETREVNPNLVGLFIIAPEVPTPPHQVQMQVLGFERFLEEIWETQKQQILTLYGDGVNGSFFTECHLPARRLASLIDLEAVPGPEATEKDAERYRLNRDILQNNPVFRDMQTDAKSGRPFSDIIVEYDQNYRSDRPLKVLGGQHRAEAVRKAVEVGQQPDRLHGIKVYFALSKEQRIEISLISNTNIRIPNPLIDRIAEHRVGPRSRDWCQEVGLLGEGDDFADRITRDKRFTVQVMRALVVNFAKGSAFADVLDESLHTGVYIPKTGRTRPDTEYARILSDNPQIWDDPAFKEGGRRFAELHERQKTTCESSSERHLRKLELRYKAYTPSIASAWAYTVGLLQRYQRRLRTLYSLPNRYDPAQSADPLNAHEMSHTKHRFDEPTYRGLGTRQSARDGQRLVELFLRVSQPELGITITVDMLRAAVDQHFAKVWAEEGRRSEERVRRRVRHLRPSTD